MLAEQHSIFLFAVDTGLRAKRALWVIENLFRSLEHFPLLPV